jgi:hypothetical protein
MGVAVGGSQVYPASAYPPAATVLLLQLHLLVYSQRKHF